VQAVQVVRLRALVEPVEAAVVLQLFQAVELQRVPRMVVAAEGMEPTPVVLADQAAAVVTAVQVELEVKVMLEVPAQPATQVGG
jgi:hypothetical protein